MFIHNFLNSLLFKSFTLFNLLYFSLYFYFLFESNIDLINTKLCEVQATRDDTKDFVDGIPKLHDCWPIKHIRTKTDDRWIDVTFKYI